MKIPYTWYRRRNETRFWFGRLVISRLIVWGWIGAICTCIYMGMSYIYDSDNSYYAHKHFYDAQGIALISIVAAGANHLLMSLFGAYFDRADRKRPP